MTNLAEAIARALRGIDADGELPYGVRVKLYDDLQEVAGERWPGVWARLEVLCARRVSAVWHGTYPDDSTPDDAIAVAERTRDGRSSREQAARELGRHKTHVDDVLGTAEPSFAPVYAGFAALAAAWSLLDGFASMGAESEMSVDPEEWTAAFFASLAECGGATWEGPEAGDSSRRRAFWEWYVRSAVPQALGGL